jgi:deoxyadenosine/deoxycytidine kinase
MEEWLTKIINLISGPGAGKSTLASGIFYELKKNHVSCELVTEYAKDMVWEKNEFVFNHQLIILSKQYRRLVRLLGQVDYVITDSPIILGCTYLHENSREVDIFNIQYKDLMEKFILETFKLFENVNFFIQRNFDTAYQSCGRREEFVTAEKLDKAIYRSLIKHDIPFHIIDQNYSIQKLISQL